MKVETKLDLTDKVIINGCASVVATVQRIAVSTSGCTYEVSWFDSGGTYREHWMYEWQLELAP